MFAWYIIIAISFLLQGFMVLFTRNNMPLWVQVGNSVILFFFWGLMAIGEYYGDE